MALRSSLGTACAVVLMAVVVTARAGAAEGMIEINQTIVNAAGGFPFTITAAGSYQLTSNLTVGKPGVNAINISASPVAIDLDGFTITGASGSGFGVLDQTGALTVQNGTIQKFNLGIGVFATIGPTVISDLSTANTTGGLLVNDARVTRYAARSTSIGVTCTGSNCAVSGATVDATSTGVEMLSSGASSLIESQITSGGDGVCLNGQAIIVANALTLTGTAAAAIRFSAGGGYGQNIIAVPAGSVCVSGGTSMGDNVCNNVKQ